MKVVCEVLGVARSNIAARAKAPLGKPRPGRPALPDDEMVMAIQAIVTEMPSYGHAPGIHRHDLVVEAWEAALILGDERQIERRLPIARDLQLDPAGLGCHRLAAVTVAAVSEGERQVGEGRVAFTRIAAADP